MKTHLTVTKYILDKIASDKDVTLYSHYMSRFTFKQLCAIAFKQWTLDDCRTIYGNGEPTKYEFNGKVGYSNLNIRVAQFVAKNKFKQSLS
jgi:hypothetical protein